MTRCGSTSLYWWPGLGWRKVRPRYNPQRSWAPWFADKVADERAERRARALRRLDLAGMAEIYEPRVEEYFRDRIARILSDEVDAG